MATAHPYLSFPGNCAEAFDFYKSVFGGEFSAKMQFKDMPGDWQAAGEGEKIMHMSPQGALPTAPCSWAPTNLPAWER